MKLIRRLYDWVLHWADTTHGRSALFLLAFAESSFFPVPPDVLLIALAIGASHRSFLFAGICTLGSVLGGLFGYLIGYGFWEVTQPFFFQYVFSPEIFEKVQHVYQEYDFWAIFVSGLTPIPYKVFTIAAGVFHINVFNFTLASIIGRGLRFFLVAGLIYKFGPGIKTFIDKYFNTLVIVFTVLLIGGFVVLKFLVH